MYQLPFTKSTFRSISYTREYQPSSTKSIWSQYLLHQRISAAIHQVHLVEVSPTPESISCHSPSPPFEVSPTPENISRHPPSPPVEVSLTPESISSHPSSPPVEVSLTPESISSHSPSPPVEVSPTPESISCHPPSPSGRSISYTREYQLPSTKSIWSKYLLHQSISYRPPSPSVEVSPTPESISCHPPSP